LLIMAAVFSQPKISSAGFRIRWLIS